MDLKKLLENKMLLASIIGGVVFLLAVFIICGTIASSKSESEAIDVSNEPLKEDVDLLTTDNLGKALEIQALLAKHGIVVARAVDGTKSVLKLRAKNCTTGAGKCTTEKRDLAIMLIVESGLYDQNVGLEVFDKGDFNLQEHTNKSFGVFQGEILDVKLSFSPELAQEASQYNFHPTQKGKWNEDGTYNVSFKASGSKEIIWHVFKWGAGCKILSPKSLQKDYKKYLQDCLNNI